MYRQRIIDAVRNTHWGLWVALLTMFLGSVAWGQSGDWKQQANDGIRALHQRDNEFNILSVDKDFQATQVDEYVAQIRQLLNVGAPIHGVGIQGHVWSKTVLEHPETLRKNLDKVAELGLPIWISEFDCAFDEEAANADCLEAVYRTAYGHPAVEGIVAWVFWAGNSWRGPNAGLARRDWSLNAAGERYEALMKEWSTDVSGVAALHFAVFMVTTW